MILKKSYRKGALKLFSNFISSNFFFKTYFFTSIFLFLSLVIIFFNLGIWENHKKSFMNRIYLNGIINYKHLPKIFIYALRKNFYSYKTIYVSMNQKNKIIS